MQSSIFTLYRDGSLLRKQGSINNCRTPHYYILWWNKVDWDNYPLCFIKPLTQLLEVNGAIIFPTVRICFKARSRALNARNPAQRRVGTAFSTATLQIAWSTTVQVSHTSTIEEEVPWRPSLMVSSISRILITSWVTMMKQNVLFCRWLKHIMLILGDYSYGDSEIITWWKCQLEIICRIKLQGGNCTRSPVQLTGWKGVEWLPTAAPSQSHSERVCRVIHTHPGGLLPPSPWPSCCWGLWIWEALLRTVAGLVSLVVQMTLLKACPSHEGK